MWPDEPLPELNVSLSHTIQFVRDLIANGQALINNYRRGTHNPRIALSHRVNCMNWSRANSDRINALFVTPVFFSRDLYDDR
jgi:hypothetical protein